MRRDVYHYFQQACRRPLSYGAEGLRWVADDDNVRAGFAFRMNSEGRVTSTQYRCTTCITLIALCEHVAELANGATAEQLRSLSPEDLIAQHPEIPLARHSRAVLAIRAARAAMEDISK